MDFPVMPPYQLPEDAVWFITGCSSGIGLALATLIAKSPTAQRVVVTARNPSSLNTTFPDGGGDDGNDERVLKTALDVTSRASVDAAFDAALRKFGRVDVVVNNAGYGLMGDAENMPDEAARKVLDTNFWGTVNVTQRALGLLRENNNGVGGRGGGVILQVTSMGGWLGSPGSSFYHASKFAVEGFSEAVAKEVLPEWNIHICNIEPGGVKTNYTGSSMQTGGPRHPAYASPEAPTSRMIQFCSDPAFQATWADPSAIAAAMYNVVLRARQDQGGHKIPTRVPLGPDAWTYVLADLERCKAEMEGLKELSCDAGNPEQVRNIVDGLK